jgi:hypothetical protein
MLISLITRRTDGLIINASPTFTVGTVSLPPVNDRTSAAAALFSQILTSLTEIPARRSPRRSRTHQGQPGRQKTVTGL